MALKDLAALATGDSPHLETFLGALLTACKDVLTESAETANHSARLNLAVDLTLDPTLPVVRKLFRYAIASNSTLFNDYTTDGVQQATIDNDTQFVVNSLLSDATLLARVGYA